MVRSLLFACLVFGSILGTNAQTLTNGRWRLEAARNGTVSSLMIHRGGVWEGVAFQQDNYAGVSWYLDRGAARPERIALAPTYEPYLFKGTREGIDYTIRYLLDGERWVVEASITNNGSAPFEPRKAGLVFGLSNYMASYPAWQNIYFPTMLRAERSHFWGYLSTPSGRMLAIASPDPIASWSLNYNVGYGSGAPGHPFWGHRVYTFNLDLLCAAPLPPRHPQASASLAPGKTRSWKIALQDLPSLDALPATLSQLAAAPFIKLDRTTLEPLERLEAEVAIPGDEPVQTIVITPSGAQHTYQGKRIALDQTAEPGLYRIVARQADGRQSEALVHVRQPWSWYMQRADEAVLRYTQKASWNCENWYGFYTAYLAQCYFPDPERLRAVDERFDLVIPLMFDTVSGAPTLLKDRIQNSSTTLGIYVDRYRATGNLRDLERAAGTADWIIDNAQAADGSYRRGKTHYTSVIYVAKSIMELYRQERVLAFPAKGEARPDTPLWRERYERHYASVKRAIDQLMLGQSAIDTEGELTFEDGMISCTALQIAAFALDQQDPVEQKRYADVAAQLLDNHACLTQMAVPDARMRGGTLRFWEAQYDVMMGNNMLTSPHGWTSWRTYATYYMYLLTGKEAWLRQTMDALGSCVQVIDGQSGKLRWAFVVDPQVRTVQSSANFPGTSPDTYNANQFKAEEGPVRPVVIGEQYVDMVADWFYANTSDNDVHEHFKCLEEVTLASCYVVQRMEGTQAGYNCRVESSGGKLGLVMLDVYPSEEVVSRVHVNLHYPTQVRVRWADGKTQSARFPAGMYWIERTQPAGQGGLIKKVFGSRN